MNHRASDSNCFKLYCPPSGDTPQYLPDYWKFADGVIRRDLQEIDDAELNLLGWTGPYYEPKAKDVINKDANLDPEFVEILDLSENYDFDTENNRWVSNDHAYDASTHKIVWYSRERRYVILTLDADTTEYGVPYRSAGTPQHRQNSEISQKKVIYKYVPENQLPAPPAILWDEFKKRLVQSENYNQFISSLISTRPALAMSFPASLSKLDLGIYTDFRSNWSVAVENDLVSSELTTEMNQIATDCNLPRDFFDVTGG